MIDKNNYRRVYNVEDYMIVERLKNCFNQYFVHIHRRKKYVFMILDIVDEVHQNNEYLWDKYLRDFVLDFLLYRQTVIQHIYGISVVASESLYFIETLYEFDWQENEKKQYLLECDWGVSYL